MSTAGLQSKWGDRVTEIFHFLSKELTFDWLQLESDLNHSL